MHKLLKYFLTISFVFSGYLMAQDSASVVLRKAFERAQNENKNVFVIFHASWCGWCKKMDMNMNADDCKNLFKKNYIIEHLTVNESPDNKKLENTGANDLLKKHGAEKSGIPFFLIFDKTGKFLEDSFDPQKQNIGCPVTKDEVEIFVKKLKTTSNLNEEELNIIYKRFFKKTE